MKVVKVLWVDSCNSNMNWTIIEDIKVEPMYINSFGVVVKDTDEFLAIAQNYGNDPEQYSNITTIPKGCIKEVFVIHEDNVCENDQEFADKVEPKFKVGDVMRTLQEASDGFKNGMPVVVSIDDEYYNCTNEKIAIKDQDDYEYPPRNRRHKPAWSEEDERHLNNIIKDFETIAKGDLAKDCPQRTKNYIPWLKSLKDRVLPQPKQEWSKEDEKILSDIIKDLVHPWNEYIPNRIEEEIKWLKNKLKSLKPQNWTKEDKERYISCLQRLGTGNPEQPETINSKWFKEHVYPQSTWKPSDEQMIAIQEAINIVGILTITGSRINSLYQDLKKLKRIKL